ncbi:MAG: methionine adenosyltransferase [Bdellovibrionales bacterium]|nr:methionine adenosyltransferase [Bdellovibrionales bacterium]
MKDFIFTSESVSEGHPDKMADQISDAILDSFLEQDSKSRVACETLVAPGLVVVSGEVNTGCYVDITGVVKGVLSSIGYNHAKKGMDYKSCSVLTTINHQSPDISQAVGFGDDQGAGDQGIMFGYAVDETDECMPLSISLSHQLMKELSVLRKSPDNDFLWPDSKSQVSVKYKDGQVDSVSSVVVSTQHSPDISVEKIREFIVEELIKKTIPKKWLKGTEYIINPGGRFVVGGPEADTGLTGRKIIVDTYGGHGSHGGGCFSGKDPSKVDRSGAYIARQIAKSLVAGNIVKKCLVQISYVIGKKTPVSLCVEDYGTSNLDQKSLCDLVLKNWSLSPGAVIQDLDLLKPRYRKTAVYGHFGRTEKEFTWEKVKSLA